MPKTGLLLDERYKDHQTFMHPEQAARIDSITQEVRGFDTVKIKASPVDTKWLLHNHTQEYLDRFKSTALSGEKHLDNPENSISEQTWDTALLAVGGVFNAVDHVMAGEVKNAFCITRPPGHHAEKDQAMGFCFLNNIALAAHYLIEKYGSERILILDWDVHHGNGTQNSFENNPKVLYASFHGHPSTIFPGTGYPEEKHSINIPMMPKSTDEDYRKAYEEQFLPRAQEFNPEFLLISAGFDAHKNDPLGNMLLETESYHWLTSEPLKLTNGKAVSVLEGGYNLQTIGPSAAQHLQALMS
jgi:acetoin utilization deacetylase AcuC-like enzyme